MINIAVLGCGQLGSRHLQSLANLERSAKIYAYDIAGEALKIAKSRYDEVKSAFSPQCEYTSDLTGLPGDFHLVIVASSSSERLEAIKTVTQGRRVRNLILEKVLFPRLEEYDIAQEIFDKYNINVWVNCNKSSNNNYFPALEKRFSQENPLYLKIEGGDWGLGCNAIHFIELFQFLTGIFEMEIDSAGLSPQIARSKRAGYIEFHGTLRAYSGEHQLELSSFRDSAGPLLIHLRSHALSAQLSLGERLTGEVQYQAEKGYVQHIEAEIYKQSQLTSTLAENILDHGRCVLPDYKQSKRNHLSLLKSLISHLDRNGYAHLHGECLIT